MKIDAKKVLFAITCVGSAVGAIMNVVSDHKKEVEFDEIKKKIEELSSNPNK